MNERATAAGGPELDLEAIMSNGDRRIRRTRIGIGVGVTAALVTAAIAVPALIDRDTLGGKDLQPVTPTGGFVTRTQTYAVDTTIYYGDDAIDVSPHAVTSLVQTDFGFVFTSDRGDHDDILFTDATKTTKIGETAQQQGTLLAADDSGAYVEWVDTEAKPRPEFVVYDTSTRQEVARTSEGNQPLSQIRDEFSLPVVHAIDGETAYWHSSAGTVAYDLTNSSQEVLRPNTSASYLFDVAGGVFAYSSQDLSTAVNTELGQDRPFVPGIGEPQLSPAGTYVMTMPKQGSKIFEVSTQRDVTPDPLKFGTVLLTQWIDDDSYVAIGTTGTSFSRDRLSMLVCRVSEGVCTPDRDSIGTYDAIVLPVGGSLTDR